MTQSSQKHTRGPWNKHGSAIVAPREFGETNDSDVIATIDMQSRLTEEKKNANARLIAAAPDLIEALQYAEKEISLIYETAKNGHTDLEVTLGQWRRLDTIRAAIAKATGEA